MYRNEIIGYKNTLFFKKIIFISNSNGGLGGCLTTILILMVFLAAFGFIDWSTVGSFARFLAAIVVTGILFMIGFWIYGNSQK
jgi:lipopolysaccharide export LptBFGC system permease protein LptF